jgi:hypothetical protein
MDLIRHLGQFICTLLVLLSDSRRYLHDRDAIFSQALDQGIRHLGLRVLKTPPHSPQTNALCERLLGTLQRECLDCVMPLTEHHLRRLLQACVWYYNAGRPHMALGPDIPQPPSDLPIPHFPDLPRFPDHIHDGATGEVTPGQRLSIFAVLNAIAGRSRQRVTGGVIGSSRKALSCRIICTECDVWWVGLSCGE